LLVQDLQIDQPDGPVSVDHVALTAVLDTAVLRLDDLHIRAEGAHLGGALAMQTVAPHDLNA